MSRFKVETSQGFVEDWFKGQDLEFCHLAMRITVDGDSTFVQFNYLPEDKHDEYVAASNSHFEEYCSLIHRAKVEHYSSEPDKIPRSKREENSTSAEAKGCSWKSDRERAIPQGDNKSEDNKKERRLKYYEILTTISPALEEKDIYEFAYCGLLNLVEETERNIGSKDTGFGVAVYYVNNKTEEENKDFSEVLFRKCLLELCNQLVFNLEKERVKAEDFRTETRKAAISQVMVRNLSHNLGSHVLANLTSPGVLLDFAKENIARQDTNKIFQHNDSEKIIVNKNAQSFNVAIASLNKYMKTRMDLLADITTTTPVVENTKIVAEATTYFNDNSVLLKKYIGGNNKKVLLHNPNARVKAAFPNDNLGFQALYIITENVIRNSAKHGNGQDVEISWKCAGSKKHKDLIEMTIYDEGECVEDVSYLVNVQNGRIENEILYNDSLRQGSWGMLEMKAAATYLRKIPVEQLDVAIEPSLLTACCVDGKYLGYTFFLLKPKKILVVLKGKEIEGLDSEEYLNEGVICMPLSDIKNSTERFSHDILLLIDCKKEDVSEVRKQISSRVVCVSRQELCCIINSDAESLVEWAWGKWLKELEGITKPPVVVQLQDDGSDAENELIDLTSNNERVSARVAKYILHCKSLPNDTHYFEIYGSNDPIAKQIEQLRKDSKYQEVNARFLESINYTVGIVDERIQKHCDREIDSGIHGCKSNRQLLTACGIEIPGSEIDLNATSFNNCHATKRKTIKEMVKEWIEEKAKYCHFVVIHIGVIERMLGLETSKDGEKRSKIEEYLSSIRELEFREDTTKNAILIITSGRGQPESLPKGERFVHYSNISNYTVENLCKFHLVQLLMTAREAKI